MQRRGGLSIHFAVLISVSCVTNKVTTKPIRGPSCHMSSFRLQEMDVLHFAAHNICRGNHPIPQRACAAVLKLSIVLAVMSLVFSGDQPGAQESRDLKVHAENPAVSQLKYCMSATVVMFETDACWIK